MIVTASVNNNEDVYRFLPDGSGFTRNSFTGLADEHGDW